MLYRLTRSHATALMATTLALTLTGCAQTGLFVERTELSELDAAIAKQRQELSALQSQARAHQAQQTLLMAQQQAATDKVLTAISEQVAKPECPPVPEPRTCPKVSSQADREKGRTDRLNNKVIVGELEKFYLVGPGYVYDARIDSGATTSSIDARNVTRFERDGENWVRFDVPIPGEADKFTTLERQVQRRVRIVQATEEDFERRVVVDLQFMIGDHQQKAEFTLADRGHMTHSVLIGRNILRDVMLIDVGKEYATELPESISPEAGASQ
ncbi:MAG: RimK/LysX family protein [Marinobacter sp.]|uniref:ATP-dependent zinc protease family protein n=1 Tax=Marinobacter sp. TaxID=50741 RepID=UPI00299E9B80|nr:RimK/LysX family protein [Marinobacter sp.]MDX1633831.1 RimK/LysX family protein [Marinobacter sp.]